MREADDRLDSREVDVDNLLVSLVVSAREGVKCGVATDLGILVGLVVYREDTVLSAAFDSHVAYGKSVVHAHIVDAFAVKLDRAVEGAVYADKSDYVEDDVLARYIWAWFAFEVEFDCARYFEPYLTAHHNCGYVGASYARRECAQRSVGTSVAVGSDNHVPRLGDAFFGKERVLDAHFAYVKKVVDAVLLRKFSNRLAKFRRLDVSVGCEVVHNEGHAIGVAKTTTAFVEYVYRNGGGYVVGQSGVYVDEYERTRFELLLRLAVI